MTSNWISPYSELYEQGLIQFDVMLTPSPPAPPPDADLSPIPRRWASTHGILTRRHMQTCL